MREKKIPSSPREGDKKKEEEERYNKMNQVTKKLKYSSISGGECWKEICRPS